MSAIDNLLNEAKWKKQIVSDNALALEIGIHRQAINNYRKGRSSPDVYTMRRLADMTERTFDEVVAMIEIETETDEAKKEYWRNFYKRLGGVAASFTTIALLAPIFAAFEGLHCILCKINRTKSAS